MTDLRYYAAYLAESSLGLVKGSLKPEDLPEELVTAVSAAVRGNLPNDIASPGLEKLMLALLDEMRKRALAEDGYFVRKARWPGAAPFAVCLTHDVDNIARSRRHIWKTRSRFSPLDLVMGLIGATSLYNNVELIASREESRGFHSSFYYLTSNYPLLKVRAGSERIRAQGWEVGLHGDFGTHDSQEKMNAAIGRCSKIMRFRPMGLREHFLKFDYSNSWKIMESSGFDYDSSIGTTDRLGFRLGLATPFHPPDESGAPMRILELPLVLMDTTLWGYLRRNEEDGFIDAMRMMKVVEDVEGLFTLLWHQEAVRMKGGRVYWRLLDEILRTGSFVASGSEISGWWRARSVPLVRKGNVITVGGTAPNDLVLKLSLAEGHTHRVTSGSSDRRGDVHLVRPQGSDFKLEVA